MALGVSIGHVSTDEKEVIVRSGSHVNDVRRLASLPSDSILFLRRAVGGRRIVWVLDILQDDGLLCRDNDSEYFVDWVMIIFPGAGYVWHVKSLFAIFTNCSVREHCRLVIGEFCNTFLLHVVYGYTKQNVNRNILLFKVIPKFSKNRIWPENFFNCKNKILLVYLYSILFAMQFW